MRQPLNLLPTTVHASNLDQHLVWRVLRFPLILLRSWHHIFFHIQQPLQYAPLQYHEVVMNES